MFAAAVLLAASCETPLFIEPVGEECQTVLQARLLTSDSLHTVHASYSLHDSVIPADDLTGQACGLPFQGFDPSRRLRPDRSRRPSRRRDRPPEGAGCASRAGSDVG